MTTTAPMHDLQNPQRARPRVLTFVKHYLPGYRMGGPTQTISNMVDRLGDDFDFHIVTSDHDMGSAQRYQNISDARWQTVHMAEVHYIAPRRGTLRYLVNLVHETSPDIIYLNSFFDPSFTQKVLAARRLSLINGIPVILAPRGEFSPGALQLKRIKKTVYVTLTRYAGLYRGLTWHASSEREMWDIQAVLSQLTDNPYIQVARNLAASTARRPNTIAPPNPRSGSALEVCFLSRISPKKNLDYALQVLSQVECPISFSIYGPCEDQQHWSKCQALIAQLPANVTVNMRGLVPHALIQETLRAHDLFFLPTRGENYGHVIHEALAAGLPVLISDQTPWNELSKEGVGWALPLDNLAEFARVIEDVATWDVERLARTRNLASQYAYRRAEAPEVDEANRQLFRSALSAR